MNGKAKWVALGWLVVACLPLFAGATVNKEQTQQGVPVRSMEQSTEFHSNLEKASKLIGAKVVNDQQQRLGTIKEIVLTPDRTAVSYAVLSHGGLWSRGGKLFAVPWSQFEVKSPGNILMLHNVSPADLKNAKGFDKNNWPAAAHEDWLGYDVNRAAAPSGSKPVARMGWDEGVYGDPVLGVEEYREHAERARIGPRPDPRESLSGAEATIAKADIKNRKFCEMAGLTVKNNQGEKLGRVRDAVIDVHTGKVAYAVLSLKSGLVDRNRKMAAVPWSALEVIPQSRVARLNADKQTLESIAFRKGEFPNLDNSQYSRQLHERFAATPYSEALGFVPGEPQGSSHVASPGMEGSEYSSQHDPSMVKTIYGTIDHVGTYRLKGTSVEGMSLRIKTDDGKMMTVQAGPRPYVDRQNISFRQGDRVTVMGSPGKPSWRNVFVASQIKKGNETVNLRTVGGKPLWNADDLKGAR